MEENIAKLAFIGFLRLLDEKATWYEHTASNTEYRIVYWDDIEELAKQLGIEEYI